MICDFGMAVILGPKDKLDSHTQDDTLRMCSMLNFLTENIPNLSEEAREVIKADHFSDDHSEPYNVPELLTYPWFNRPAVPSNSESTHTPAAARRRARDRLLAAHGSGWNNLSSC